MDVNQVDSIRTYQERPSAMVELEAQMASLLSLHNATSDVNLSNMSTSTSRLGIDDVYTTPATDFVSVIKFHGQPIPPPVLSLSGRLEMQAYKEAAIKKEQDIVSRRRRKLLDTVQGIVDRFEVHKQASRESSPRDAAEIQDTDLTHSTQSTQYSITLPGLSDTNITLPGLSDTNITLPGLTTTDKLRYNQAVEEREHDYEDNTPAILQEIDDMLGTKLCDDINTSVRDTELMNVNNVTHQTDSTKVEETKNQNVPPLVSDSISSSEESALNRTVIAADEDTTPRADTGHTDTEHSFNPPFQSTAIGDNIESDKPIPHQAALQEVMSSKDGNKMRDSWADSESNMSLLGEYHLLPTPSPDINPDVSVSHEQSSKDPQEAKERAPEESASNTAAVVSADFSTLSGTQTLSGTHSTQLTLDTVAQSCTLPLSLFSSSSNSTLCEVQDPFTSYTDETTPFEVTGEQGGLTRGTPVGQESSNTESCSEPQAITICNNKSTVDNSKVSETDQKHSSPEGDATSADEFKSPRKRVRRNSYTLDHPSPALLDAKARNEAPYASDEGSPQVVDDKQPTVCRSLNLGDTKETVHGETKPEQSTRPDKDKKKQDGSNDLSSNEQQKEAPSLTEDNLLRLQMEQFEHMRRQMEEKQKKQLEEMLQRQQQEQLALQKEMAALELRANQQNSSKIYSSVFGMEDLSQGASRIGNFPGVTTPVKERSNSDATVPSLRDSLENALPPISSVMTPNSHTSPAIHTRTSQLYTTDTSHSHGHETELPGSTPFYLEHDRSIDLDYMDVERSALSAWTPASDVRAQKIYTPSMQAKFERVSAAVKGYLTRRLMQTHKVQSIIQTIRDTVYFVDDFQAETPIKNGRLTTQDVQLAERLLSQLSTARNELYDTFQTLPARDRMAIIAQSRTLEQQALHKTKEKSPDGMPSRHTPVETKPLSAATLKALERKNKAKKLEHVVSAPKQSTRPVSQRTTKRPKSGDNRILRPLQGNQSPPGPVGAPFRFTASSTSKDALKPKPVIHRHTATNKNVKTKPKSSANTTTNTAAGKKPKGVRRSLYPTTTGVSKGPAKGTSKGTRTTVLNKK